VQELQAPALPEQAVLQHQHVALVHQQMLAACHAHALHDMMVVSGREAAAAAGQPVAPLAPDELQQVLGWANYYFYSSCYQQAMAGLAAVQAHTLDAVTGDGAQEQLRGCAPAHSAPDSPDGSSNGSSDGSGMCGIVPCWSQQQMQQQVGPVWVQQPQEHLQFGTLPADLLLSCSAKAAQAAPQQPQAAAGPARTKLSAAAAPWVPGTGRCSS
jgi:hypothetical protein